MNGWTRGLALPVLLVAAGCGGSPSAKPAPFTPSVSASTSASASPSGAPTRPAEATGTTPESAEAFVRYYLDVLSYAALTNDVSALKPLGAAACRVCDRLSGQISEIYGSGGSVTRGGYSLTDVRRAVATGDRVRIHASVNQHQQDAKRSASSPVKHYPRHTLPSIFVVRQVNGSWQLLNWERT